MTPSFRRAIVIVLDSVGCGELPDAASYGDEGSDTLGNIHKRVPLAIPTLRALGLDRVATIGAPIRNPQSAIRSACGRMAEASAGKDSVTGHWEMMGIVLERPFPVFPNGFSPEILKEIRFLLNGMIEKLAKMASRARLSWNIGCSRMVHAFKGLTSSSTGG